MKKLIFLMLILVSVFSLFSCGDPNEGFVPDKKEDDPYSSENKYGDAYLDDEDNIVLPPIKVN